MPSSQNKQLCCSICLTKKESMFYVCKSGKHVICKNCQRLDNFKHRHDDGDHKNQKECPRTDKKDTFQINSSDIDFHYLASGDNYDSVEKKSALKITISNEVTQKRRRLTTSTPKENPPKQTETSRNETKNNETKNDIVTIMAHSHYKNRSDSKSSETIHLASFDTIMEEKYKMPNQDPSNCRPVTCPVTECSRMVILDSFSQHFHFDHSKVPKYVVDETKPQDIFVNYLTLSTDAKCLAYFIAPERSNMATVRRKESPTSLHNYNKSTCILLLMGSKILITSAKQFYNPISRVSTKNSVTQTDNIKRNIQLNQQCIRKNSSKNIIGNKSITSDDEDEEVILLWLVKMDDRDKSYTITAIREDRKQGYSYTGDAVYIRNKQNPISIYNNAECLSINKTAISKLVSPKYEFKVFVTPLLY